MRIERRYTKEGQSAYADIEFRLTTSEIKNPDGSVVFRLDDIEVPAAWSQVATDILAQKYFRKAGVPARAEDASRRTPSPPSCGARCPTTTALDSAAREASASSARPTRARSSTGSPAPGPIGAGRAAISTPRRTPTPSSTSSATCSPTQKAAPNSPQWFNTGLHWAYGIDGPSQGHYYVDPVTGKLDEVGVGLRASAAACLLHPVGLRRPRQRRRHHGSVGARGAPVQIRLRHRLQFLARCAARARGCPAAASPPA